MVKGAWFLLALGVRMDRRRLLRAMALMFSGYLAAPFSALALAAFTNDALGSHVGTVAVPPRPGPALEMALLGSVLLVAQLMCSHFAHLDYFELGEMQYAHLNGELMEVVNGPPTVGHLDNPAFSNDLQLVRENLFSTTRSLEAVLQLMGLLLQTAATAVILIQLNPLLPCCRSWPCRRCGRATGPRPCWKGRGMRAPRRSGSTGTSWNCRRTPPA